VSAEEVARELGVSESTVKRAGQKRKAAEMTHRTEQDDQPGDGKTAVPDSADHPDEDQQCDLPPDTISKEIPEKEGTDSNHEQRVNNHLNEGLSQLMMAQALYLLPSAPVVAIEELEEMLQRITDCIATFGSRK
jgi:DNA-binding transcriptional MocR family regulator